MKQLAHVEPGAIRRAGELIDSTGARSVLLVTGRASFARCGAESALRGLLAARRVARFSDFEANPKLADLERGLDHCRRHAPDLILSVGGGSVLDMAKLIGILSTQEAAP